MAIKKGDFVKFDFTAKTRDEGIVFDTSIEQVAKDKDIFSKNAKYIPMQVCVGEKQVLPGLDDALVGKDANAKFSVELAPEVAFGKKEASLIVMVPMAKFKENKIQPLPGLQVDFDGRIGVVKSAGGGRVLVDFNHPLSGRFVVYDVELKGAITDKAEQVKCLLMPFSPEVKVEGNKAVVSMALPEQLSKPIAEKIKNITGLDVEFKAPEAKKPVEKLKDDTITK